MTEPQRQLFEVAPEPWEADDRSRQLVAAVVFPTGPAKPFDYCVPDALRENLAPGARVKAPFGPSNRLLVGYCVRIEEREVARRLKPLHSIIDQRSLLMPAMLQLTDWIAERYLCDWATVLEAVLPAGVRTAAGTRPATLLSVDKGALSKKRDELKLTEKQEQILRTLAAADGPMTPGELARAARTTLGPISTLRRKGLIRSRQGRVATFQPPPRAAAREEHLILNPDQRKALDAILGAMNARRHRTILIHGVTGSGKTEVYIQAIQEVVNFGRQAIVLVPEISLTPQTVERFRRRFSQVAVLHSHLSDQERHVSWQRIADGSAPVIVGARSAVFAPAPNLGLIVLDEEHESSFKQQSAPRYHAREVALARAEAEGIPLVLGSATPSLESWQRAIEGRYQLVQMPRRVLDRPLPAVGTIDLRNEFTRGAFSRGAVSRPLQTAINSALADGGQVILLLNRRGYSTHIQCPACGQAVRCPHCDIALTHHRTEQIALCHYCDHHMPAPTCCPECGFSGIRYSGLGTQRLEAEVRSRFPNNVCLRMDTDAMQKPGSHDRALAAFRAGKVDILLGTQMIAKGLDFPNVTLVGVVNADTALHLPDFRAAERTFQLVTQVAGRTGRGPKGGRVLVQTFCPEHPAIQAAVRHDYAAFAAGELPIRQMLGYPPFAEMIRLVVRGPSAPIAAEFARRLAERLQEAVGEPRADARVLGPAPCPFARLKGVYRFQIQLHGPDGAELRAAVNDASAKLQKPDDVQWIADVDPVDML
jgi:primosomal protein N' (replication factor Y)